MGLLKIFSGWTTIIGGIVLLLTGLANGASAIACQFGVTTPGIPCGELTTATTMIGAGLTAVGVGHKGNKIIAALTNGTAGQSTSAK